MAALLLDLEPGDEVIVPSFTFVSTVNAFVLRGARPVFADVRPDTLNLDETPLERSITPRTKAIVAVHYAGVGCEMDAILRDRRGATALAVVEDNAHGLFGTYRGRPLGTFGALATQSFHETKNFTCGEGGALVVNDAVARRAGRDPAREGHRPQPLLPRPGRQVHVGRRRLELRAVRAPGGVPARRSSRRATRSRPGAARVWERLRSERLAELGAAAGVRCRRCPAHCEQPSHMFYLLLPTSRARTR